MDRQDETRLLAAWESAHQLPGWLRPLAVGALLDSGPPLQDAPLGVVSSRLLALAQQWSGDRLDGVVRCEECGEQLGVDLPVDELIAAAPVRPVEQDGPPTPPPLVQVSGTGWSLTARLPTPSDLAAVAREPDVTAARARLVARLVVSAEPGELLDDAGTALVAERALERALEQEDPLASIRVTVACSACGAAGTAVLDMAGWWWALVDARVQQLLHEVHRLASAYGWSEQDVLAVGPHRRARYLELVG
jgi:hypothetical protein